ncbi:Uncharacterised protein [Bordetella ansorpii]|uniref:Uncharacterized protein n=1 Tax=Bordetella ansorpii TaxID=288768 RepID=A0A157LYP6_9BORD|nr:Uncharacterised protein [Bordetella ansorpii]
MACNERLAMRGLDGRAGQAVPAAARHRQAGWLGCHAADQDPGGMNSGFRMPRSALYGSVSSG